MFEKRRLRREVAQLTAENARISAELTEVQQSPAYALAQIFIQRIDAIMLTDSLSYSQDIDKLFNDLMQEGIDAGHEITEEVRAQVLDAVEKFMRERALELRTIPEGQRNIVASVAIAQGALPMKVEKPVDPELKAKRDEQKRRARELLMMTRKSHILPLEMLQENDLITLGFASPDKAHMPVSDGSGGVNDYLEQRSITCRVVDPTRGVVEIDEDSWLELPSKGDQILRGGRFVRLRAKNPDAKRSDFILVKSQELFINGLEGEVVPLRDKVHLWRVSLGDFRVMS